MEGNLFALKVLEKNKIRGAKHIQHIMNERDVLKKVNYPERSNYAVGFHQTMQDEQRLYLILEYLPNGELFKTLNSKMRQTLPEHVIKLYLAEIVQAVDDLHNKNIIYRDLKPENVLIDA